jgi:hypothetical protein
MIRVQCPKCAWRFAADDNLRGRSERCPQCATAVAIPASPASDAPAVPTIARWATFVNTPLSDVDDRLRHEFDRYLDALSTAVRACDLFAPTGPGADLLVPVTLHTGGKPEFTSYFLPAESIPREAAIAALFRALMAVPAPVTRGPAAQATIIFSVRGGSGQLQLASREI